MQKKDSIMKKMPSFVVFEKFSFFFEVIIFFTLRPLRKRFFHFYGQKKDLKIIVLKSCLKEFFVSIIINLFLLVSPKLRI